MNIKYCKCFTLSTCRLSYRFEDLHAPFSAQGGWCWREQGHAPLQASWDLKQTVWADSNFQNMNTKGIPLTNVIPPSGLDMTFEEHFRKHYYIYSKTHTWFVISTAILNWLASFVSWLSLHKNCHLWKIKVLLLFFLHLSKFLLPRCKFTPSCIIYTQKCCHAVNDQHRKRTILHESSSNVLDQGFLKVIVISVVLQ